MTLHKNLSMTDAIRYAREHGIEVRQPNRTGEVMFVGICGRYRANNRRKDAGRKLVCFLRKAARP